MGEVNQLFRQMKKALMERALAGELTHHLGYGPGEAEPAVQPITATEPPRRRCSPKRGPSRSRFPAIGPAPSSRSSFPKMSAPAAL